MLKKTITYEDPFSGVQVTEDLYFNLTKAEIIEMEMSVEGGLKEHLEGIARAENGQQIMNEMKGIILKAYGKKTDTGKFIKTQQVREEFEASEAYSTLFVEMVTETDAAVEFVNGIMPKGLEELGQQVLPVDEAPDRPNLTNLTPVPPAPEPRKITRAEAMEMQGDDLRSGLAEGRYILE